MKPLLPKPALFDPLTAILPTTQQTWLLNACLASEERGLHDWIKWKESVLDPIKVLGQGKQGYKRLLPLLFTSLNNNQISVDKAFLTYLRTAYVREEVRHKTFQKICHLVFEHLTRKDTPVIVIRGTALAESVYESPLFRHCHDIDLLVRDEDIHSVIRTLQEIRVTPSRQFHTFGTTIRTMKHESDLPVALHTQLFSIPFYNVAPAEQWARSEWNTISGMSMRTLSPCDNLLHVCGNAAVSNRRGGIGWVCDSWMIIHRTPNLDWDQVNFESKRRRLTLPLLVIFSYFASELQAAIPEEFLRQLNDSGRQADWLSQDAALLSSRIRTGEGKRPFFRRAHTWTSKTAVLRSMLLPSHAYLRWIEPAASTWRLPFFYYLYRLMKYITRLSRFFWGKWVIRFLGKNTFLATKENR
jgi:hypothetical protein